MDSSESATRRRNTPATGKFSLYAPPPPPPPIDLELLSIKSPPSSSSASQAYTSLRDVMPSGAVGSPSGGARTPHGGAWEISIRNRLVKQAAWAYLQPMSASPSYSGTDYFHRLRCQFAGGGSPVAAVFGRVVRAVRRVLDRLLRAIGFTINR